MFAPMSLLRSFWVLLVSDLQRCRPSSGDDGLLGLFQRQWGVVLGYDGCSLSGGRTSKGQTHSGSSLLPVRGHSCRVLDLYRGAEVCAR
jgi:hypothetical protein